MQEEKSPITTQIFLKNIAKFSLPSWINFALGVFAVVAGTRVFSPEVYGILNIFNNTSEILMAVSCLGLNTALLRFFHEPPEGWDKRQVFLICILIPVCFLGMIFILLAGFYEAITIRLFQYASIFIFSLVIIKALSSLVLLLFSQYHRMMSDSRRYAIQSIATVFFSRVFFLLSVFVSSSVDVVLFFNSIGIFVWMIVWTILRRKEAFPAKVKFDFVSFRPVLRFAAYDYPSSLLVPLTSFVISFLISRELGNYALGVFASANFFISAFSIIQKGFRTYWAAFMYEYYGVKQDLIISVHNGIAIFLFFVLALFIIVQHGAYLFIGAEFQGSRAFFTILLVPALMELWEQTTYYGILIEKRMKERFLISVAVSSLGMILAYFFLRMWGLVGVPTAMAMASIAEFCLLTWRGQRYYRSIETAKKTIAGMILILALAFSNYIFQEKYWFEFSVVLLLSVFFLIVYQQDIKRLRSF